MGRRFILEWALALALLGRDFTVVLVVFAAADEGAKLANDKKQKGTVSNSAEIAHRPFLLFV